MSRHSYARDGGLRRFRRRSVVLTAIAAVVTGSLFATPAHAVVTAGTTYDVPGISGIAGIACGSTTSCVAIGSTQSPQVGALVPLVNGVPGPVETVPQLFNMEGIACPSASFCLAEGQADDGSLTLVSVVQGGVRQVLPMPGVDNPGQVACSSPTLCVVALQPDVVRVDVAGDGTLSAAVTSELPPGTAVFDIACYSATACIGAGVTLDDIGNEHGILVPFSNGAAGGVAVTNGVVAYAGIGCDSSGACLAVGESSGFANGLLVPVTVGGAAALRSVGPLDLKDVACPSVGQCVEVGSGATYVATQSTTDGTLESQTSLSIQPFHVACPSPTTCIAGGVAASFDHGAVQTFTVSPPGPGFSASPSSVAFGSHRVNTSTPSTVTVTNTGGSPLVISHVAVTGTNAKAFKIVSNSCTGSIAPGQTCSTTVSFKPTLSKNYSAALTYTDNVTGSPQSVVLTGRGCTAGSSSSCV